MSLSKITPCLWFSGDAEEAVSFYTSVFKESKTNKTQRYTESGQELHGQQPGSVMVIEFELNGHAFVAMNGPPIFKFSEAISFMVECKDQAEVDYYYERLGEGADESKRQCGWLGDKYGLAWQIVPVQLKQLMSDPDAAKVKRVNDVMLKMKKLNIAELQRAYDGSSDDFASNV